MMDRDFDGAWWRLAFLMLCSQPLLAQAWTAQALVDETLAANPGVDALQQAVAAAAWQVEPAGALDDPQLTYAIAPRSVDAAGIDPGHILGVAQPLPWPGKRAAQRKAAESDVRVAESDLRALQLALSASARQAYAELNYLHGALRINAEQQQRLAKLQQATSGRYRAGAGSQHALLRASTRLAERRRQALELTAQRRMVEARVNAMRNRPIHSNVPQPSGWSTLPVLPPIAALEGALRQSNPRLLKLQAQGRTAQLNRELAALAYKPDLRLTANYLGTLPRSEYRTQVGVMLNLPLGQSKRRAAEAAADARIAGLEAEQRQQVQHLVAALAEQVAADRAAAQMLQLYRGDLVPLARQTLEAAMADYASGRGDVDAVINAEEGLLQARVGRLAAEARQWKHRARIARLTGGMLDEQLLGETGS